MRDALLLCLVLGSLGGLIYVHMQFRRRRVLALTIFLDVVVGALAICAGFAAGTFQTWMQEDGWAEWATVYGFSIAAVVIGIRLARWRKQPEVPGWLSPLMVAAVAAFCVFVAGEEISWGQRMFAFEPPEIFLRENFQQELNLHNLLNRKEIAGFKLDSRFLVALVAIVYGGILPGLKRWAPVPKLAPMVNSITPPWELTPWFLAVAAVELDYPTELVGEACELVLGMLFLCVAVVLNYPQSLDDSTPIPTRRAAGLLVAPLALGMLTQPVIARVLYGADEQLVAQAEAELEMLRGDVLTDGVIRRKLRRKKRVHKRVFTAVQARYFDMTKAEAYLEGQPTPATKDAVEPRRDRRGYFLDPWNNPYWVLVTKKGRRGILYSFGPNRRRDTKLPKRKVSKKLKPTGDDILVHFSLRKSKPK